MTMILCKSQKFTKQDYLHMRESSYSFLPLSSRTRLSNQSVSALFSTLPFSLDFPHLPPGLTHTLIRLRHIVLS